MFQGACSNSRAKSRARSPNIAITSSRAVASLGRSTAYLLAFEPWDIRISYVGITATSSAIFLGSAAKQSRTSRLRDRHRSVDQGQQRCGHDQLSHHGSPELGPLAIMVTGSAITRCGKPYVRLGVAARRFSLADQRLISARGRCLAAPVAHIAEHFTIAGKKLLAVHAKWIGRYDRRGVKLQHGSVLFI
jgi:hypothetical protein